MILTFPKVIPSGPGRRSNSSRDPGFTLIEILVAVTLLSVIVLGLMAMFGQTQRAFRLGMSQTDVLEDGRVATDMIVREVEQITPSFLEATNVNSPSFYAVIPNYPEVVQPLPGGATRTNVFHDLYFLTRENQTWTGIGYFVRNGPSNAAAMGPVGSLYRIQIDSTPRQFVSGAKPLTTLYFNDTNRVSKLLDGVVEFRINAFDALGRRIAPPEGATSKPYYWNTNILADPNPPARAVGEVGRYTFYSNAAPAFVEVEIGLLEKDAYEKYKSIPVVSAQEDFLSKQAAHVHLFRQRIAIRNVDTSAYQ